MATGNTSCKTKSFSKDVSCGSRAKLGRFSFWLNMTKPEQAEHLNYLEHCLMAPFLIEMCSFHFPKKVLGWLKETELTKHQIKTSCRPSQTLTRKQLEVVECAEIVMNILLPALNSEHSLRDFSDIVAKVEQVETVSEVVYLMRPPFLTYFSRKVLKRLPAFDENHLMLLAASLLTIVMNYLNEIEEDHSCSRLMQFKSETNKRNVNLETLQEKGNKLFRSGQFRSAIAMYSKAIEMSPFNGVLYGNRAQCYLKIRSFQEALSDARQAVFLKPHWVKAYYRYAAACYELGFHMEAVKVNAQAQAIFSGTKKQLSQEKRFRRHKTEHRSNKQVHEVESRWLDPQFEDMSELKYDSDGDSGPDCDSSCDWQDSLSDEETKHEDGNGVWECGEALNSLSVSPFPVSSRPVSQCDILCACSDDDKSFASVPDFDRYSVSSCDHSFDEFENEINPSSSSSVDEDELPSEVGASNSENASAASDQFDSILPCDVSCMFSDKEEDFSNLVPDVVLQGNCSESDGEEYHDGSEVDGLASGLVEESNFIAELEGLTKLFFGAISSRIVKAVRATVAGGAEVDSSAPGVLPGVIEWLPKIRVTQKHLDDGKCCSICHCEYDLGGDATLLPCKHFYHESCISKWLKMHATCPTCCYVLP